MALKRLYGRQVAVIALTVGALCFGTAGFADVQGAAQSYTADYFTKFSPRSALDMVERVPGFNISGGNNNGRGLGQGGGNVLINGARISGKAASPRETLSRIPAGTVLSVEIVDGASLSVPGLFGEVANIRVKPAALSGTWEWKPELRETQEPNLQRGNISLTGQIGDVAYTAGLDLEAYRGGADGPEFQRRADGRLYEIANERARARNQAPEGTIALTYERGDITANLNANYRQLNSNSEELSDRGAIGPGGETRTILFDRYEDERKGEISADITFGLFAGSLKLIGVSGFEDSPRRNRQRVFKDNILTNRTEFYSQGDEGEKILRAEYSRDVFGHDWQISAERALNFVDLSTVLFETENGIYRQSVLDDPQVRVEEDRSEITLSHSRALSAKLELQASLGVEQSTLSQTGNAPNERKFIRPKGFAYFSYAASDSLTARLEIERQVRQLNFFDFISNVDIEDDNSKSSNSELVPQQLWNYAAEFEKEFGAGNSVLLRMFYEDIEDLVARIPLGPDSDAVGNIAQARSYGLKLESTLKGAQWGFPGTQLDLEYFVQKSDVNDPVTGISRRIDGRRNTFAEINFRHDIPGSPWAYGFSAERFYDARRYSLEEISGRYFTGPSTDIFIEHKDVFGMTANIKLVNLLGIEEGFRRTVYEGRRDIAAINFTQKRERDFGRILRMTFSGSF